ncbi:outer membrane beta-barrel protein [Helicobacter sp. 13S00477-4]|uniref:outer membrane beta-barrel protein n=1 Tax=Helicobacter sp. 13S00477-4 TaxID=1905759 RepID=UPI000BA71835|nr:outer membrane beta-barrel protein [Helicobacter sp. 13S00477-4]PAF52262.1 hypothetical protein BKH44_02840 [Helicobacter sp. 13S00477-4]
MLWTLGKKGYGGGTGNESNSKTHNGGNMNTQNTTNQHIKINPTQKENQMNPLHKSIFALLFVIASFISFAQARFFMGIDDGYSIDTLDYDKKSDTGEKAYIKKIYKGGGNLFSLNLGTQHYFDKNQFIGFRWLLNLEYGNSVIKNQFTGSSYFTTMLGGSIALDILFDVLKLPNSSSIGFFGGIDAGSEDLFIKEGKTFLFYTPQIQLKAHAGLSIFIADHHRIEFVAKIPVYTHSFHINDRVMIYKPIQLMLGYKFVF